MFQYNTIEEALQALRNGEVILVTDDEDRENEGDLICAAEFATTENVNFMASQAKGLICMPMSKAFTQKLGLPQMVEQNTDNHATAFTVSIDHVDTTTGISAYCFKMCGGRCKTGRFPPSGTYVSVRGKAGRRFGAHRSYGGNSGFMPFGRSERVRSML